MTLKITRRWTAWNSVFKIIVKTASSETVIYTNNNVLSGFWTDVTTDGFTVPEPNVKFYFQTVMATAPPPGYDNTLWFDNVVLVLAKKECTTCKPGSYCNNSVMQTCPANFYCSNGTQTPCPPNSASPPNSDNRLACLCAASYYNVSSVVHPSGMSCALCPANNYCPGDNTLRPCAAYSSSLAQSSQADNCTCMDTRYSPPYRLAVLELSQYYMSDLSNSIDPRIIINGRLYTDGLGWSPLNGWTARGYIIIDMLGVVTIQGVATGGWALYNRYVSTSKFEISNDGVNYVTYNEAFPGQIEIAPQFFYPPIKARYLKFTPITVVNAQNMMIGVYVSNGTFNFPRTCDLCLNGSFCAGSVLTYCPDNSSTNSPASTLSQCSECKSGYIKTGPTSCRPCSIGSYCTDKNTELPCPANTYSNETARTSCIACPTHSTSPPGSKSLADCGCDPGFQVKTVQNRACLLSVSNYGFCIPASRNILHYTGVNNALLEAAVTAYEGLGNTGNKNIWINPDMIIGDMGVISIDINVKPYGGTTVQLDLRSPKTMGNFYFFNSHWGTSLQVWAGNSTSNMFMLVNLLQQVEIAYTYYAMVQATNGVTARYLWLYFSGGASGGLGVGTFQLDRYSADDRACPWCPEAAYCANGKLNQCPPNTTSLSGSAVIENCTGCVSGYFKTGNLSCRTCTAGFYCVDKNTETQCALGVWSSEGATSCTSCAANTYADSPGTVTCKACQPNSMSPVGSISRSKCNCNPGYYRDVDFNCIVCPAGFKCTGNNLMTACTPGTAATEGQSTCTPCAAGSYGDMYTMSSCQSCPAGPTVLITSNAIVGNGGGDRANHPTDSGYIYIQRKPLPSNTNFTKWSFYAFQACTVTPIIADTVGAVANTGYGTISFTVTTVGTTRSVSMAGSYTYDFAQGQRIASKTVTSAGGSLYYNQNYLGWYFQGPACIPYEIAAQDAYASNDYIVQSGSYDTGAVWSAQTFTATFTARTNMRYSVSLTSVVTASALSSGVGSSTIFNCSCGTTLRTLLDGNCQGFCIDGKYMANELDMACSNCTQGSFCLKSVKSICPPGKSSLTGASQCLTCVGPDTHTDLSLAMCGLKTCPSATPVAIPGTPWKALGRITTGLGGDGVIPNTPWFSAYKCLGMVLNASADRPVTLLYQTLTVTPNQSYALRFKVVCTGAQCGAAFAVTYGNTTIYSSNPVARSWTEAATPYFTTTGTSITIQFRGQMVTSSCTIWLAQVELVDLGRWSYPSISALRLLNGAFLPVRYSASYFESQQLVLMQVTDYIQQSLTVLPNNKYELSFWMKGAVDALAFNGTGWAPMDPRDPMDAIPGWTHRVFHVTPAVAEIGLRLVGPGTISPPTFALYAPVRPCAICLAGYWCKGATMNKCPLNTDSIAGSSLQTDCFCSPGYYGQIQLGATYGYSPCAICPMNFYCDGGNQMTPCPPGTKSQPGSTLAGCTPCAEGEFCENGQVGVCPANSYAPAGSNDIGDCSCMPGFYGTMGVCTQCESGFFCQGGSNKTACTAHAASPVGSTDASQCFCDRGYYGVNNSACTACPVGSWCWTGVRNDCPANTWSPPLSSFQVNCTCAAGYTGPDGGPCTACSLGYFKPERGTGACAACPVGTSSTTAAATSQSTCAMCNHGHFNPYTGQSACLACDAGTSAGAFGSTSCPPCPAGGWSPAGAAACIACVGGTYSNASAATGGETCKLCPTGSWSGPNATSCYECGACAYWSWPMRVTATLSGSPVLRMSIYSNMQSFMALASSTQAIVSEGSALYTVDISTNAVANMNFASIESLPFSHMEASRDRNSLYLVQTSIYRVSLPSLELQNQYLATNPMGVVEWFDGQTIWVTQPDGLARFSVVTENMLNTVPYPQGLSSVSASPCTHPSYPDTVFLAGKASSTTAFGFRRFQVSTGTWGVVSTTLTSLNKCTFTPDGNFAVLTAITGTWLYSMTEGTFAKIFTGQINGVIANQELILLARQSYGIYRQAMAIQDSRNCGPGLFSASGGLSSQAQCEICPAGSLCPGGANNTRCAPGSFSLSTGLRSQGQCTPCPMGRFCTGGTASQLCPLGSYSLATSVTRVSDCSVCPAGFYCPNTTAIVICPSNTMSPPGSSDLASCTCNAGYRCDITKVVHAEVTLPISVSDFEALRQAYINAVAAAAGVDPSQVIIVSVTSTAPAGRRLLSVGEFAEVHTSIYGSKHVAQPTLALLTLQRHLMVRGLPRHESNMKIVLHHEVTGSKMKLLRRDLKNF